VARDDLKQLYLFFIKQNPNAAGQILDGIKKGIALLECSPFSFRKSKSDSPFLREILLSFNSSGCVALFKIEENLIVTILAIRHQRECDFYL
jgi:plasmid stabilization system protein ParE